MNGNVETPAHISRMPRSESDNPRWPRVTVIASGAKQSPTGWRLLRRFAPRNDKRGNSNDLPLPQVADLFPAVAQFAQHLFIVCTKLRRNADPRRCLRKLRGE